MIPKIFPRNLTARAAMQVAGNPVITRLESGVGNCFPGLEFDHRNLDRRFFPGLIFEFVSVSSNNAGEIARHQGARLVEVDLKDSDLDPNSQSVKELAGAAGQLLQQGTWFLETISQGGKTISLFLRDGPLDGMVVWRLVRCLEPGPVTIQLKHRPQKEGGSLPARDTVNLSGTRRAYVNPQTGVISAAYEPGELTQSLCSPWMHDFRDCACFYWASNHPDIVLGESLPGEPALPGGAPEDPVRALTPIDWLRADRASTAPAQDTDNKNRPAQMDHYEINQRWQDLAIVLKGREIAGIYHPSEPETANPLATPDELAAKLAELATLEHAVALEYLYARYSLKDPGSVAAKGLQDDLVFVRHEILFIAVSEMRHLRWANQLIWSLEHDGLLNKKIGPSLGIAQQIPVADDKSRPPQSHRIPGAKNKTRPPDLRPLTPDVLTDFIAVEQPSGFLDGQYARVLATLRQKQYRETLEQLASRIIADGVEHFSRFREIQILLTKYEKSLDHLRAGFKPASASDQAAKKAMQIYRNILSELGAAYGRGDMEDAVHIARARTLMFELDDEGNRLATRNLGIPFFS